VRVYINIATVGICS